MMTREVLRQAALWGTFFCGAIVFWAGVCRLNASTPRTVRPRVRAQLALLVGMGATLALSPFGLVPRWALLFIAGTCLAVFVLLGMSRWRHGVPPEIQSDRMALDASADTQPMEGPRP